jgi:hypothetical protein
MPSPKHIARPWSCPFTTVFPLHRHHIFLALFTAKSRSFAGRPTRDGRDTRVANSRSSSPADLENSRRGRKVRGGKRKEVSMLGWIVAQMQSREQGRSRCLRADCASAVSLYPPRMTCYSAFRLQDFVTFIAIVFSCDSWPGLGVHGMPRFALLIGAWGRGST